MGYTAHDAIIVTTWDESLCKEAHAKANAIFGNTVSGIVQSPVNLYHSFFVAPDGSKEGWEESDVGDMRRGVFINWMKSKAYDDGSNSLDWVAVRYEEDGTVAITSHRPQPNGD